MKTLNSGSRKVRDFMDVWNIQSNTTDGLPAEKGFRMNRTPGETGNETYLCPSPPLGLIRLRAHTTHWDYCVHQSDPHPASRFGLHLHFLRVEGARSDPMRCSQRPCDVGAQESRRVPLRDLDLSVSLDILFLETKSRTLRRNLVWVPATRGASRVSSGSHQCHTVDAG